MNISIYLPIPMLSKVKNAAEKDQRSISGFIRLAISNQIRINESANANSNTKKNQPNNRND
jgi:hypothetical protein